MICRRAVGLSAFQSPARLAGRAPECAARPPFSVTGDLLPIGWAIGMPIARVKCMEWREAKEPLHSRCASYPPAATGTGPGPCGDVAPALSSLARLAKFTDAGCVCVLF
jgi:hypothetical protein